MAVERDPEAKAIMQNAQQEEFKHFAMDLEFLIRRTPKWRAALHEVLFKEGDIVEHGEEAEAEANGEGTSGGGGGSGDGSLGIGSLKGEGL